MQDARSLTQRIDALLTADALPDADEAASLAAAYARLSRQAHDRLTRCQELLARGLRSEAVQEAETEPTLLVLVSSLELQRFHAWQDFCRRHDLPAPCEVRPDVVAELNRAYAAEQLVSPLLREYRLRCVVRAPLTARIAALRGVAGVDRGNRAWADALIELERQRLTEIPDAVQSAMGDVEALQNLQRELIDDRRKVPAPPRLLDTVAEALQDSRVRHAQRQLEAMLPVLGEAYSAMDYPACRALLDNWTQTLKAVGRTALQVPEHLREAVEPALRWVEQQAVRQENEAAFHRACRALTDAVEDDEGVDPLAAALAEAESFEQPLPGSLGEDARAELARRRAVQTRRRRTRQAAVAVVVLGLCGAVAWTIHRAQVERDVDQRLAQVRTALDDHDVDAAGSLWLTFAQARSDHTDTPRARDVYDRLDAAKQEEERRADAFAQHAATLAESADEELTQDELALLSELARLADDHQQVEALRDRYRAHRAKVQQANDRAALEVAATLRTRLRGIGSDALDREPQAVLATAADAAEQLRGLQQRDGITPTTQRVIASVTREAVGLREGAQAVLDQRELRRQRAEAETQLARYTSRPALLAGQLADYAKRFPDAPLTPAFSHAASDVPAWEAVEAWLAVREKWRGDPAPATLQQAAQRLRDLEAYTQSHDASPMAPALSDYRSYWGAAILASADDGPWRGRLPELLRAPIFRDLGVAETTDGRRFYIVGDGNRRETSLGTAIDVVLSPDTTQTTTKTFAPGLLGPVEPSPQSELAAELLARVSTYELDRWHTFPVDVVETVLDADAVDPVLRGVLVELLLNNLEEATGRLHPDLAALRDRIAVHGEQAVNWLNPDDMPARTTRRFMEKVLAEPRDPDRWRAALAVERASVSRGVSPHVLQRAVLMPDIDGRPIALTHTGSPPKDAEVWAVAAGEASEASPRFLLVGRVSKDGLKLEPWAKAQLPFGSMLWLLEATPDEFPGFHEDPESSDDRAELVVNAPGNQP